MTKAQTPSPVQTIFLGWEKPALPTAAERIADAYAGAHGLDLRGVLIVTPGARAGRRLMELLLEEAERTGVPLTPPDTVTIGRFPERLYTPTGPLVDSTVTRHAFAQALKKTDPDLLGDVFPELAPNLAGWMALAGIVEKLHREVGAEGKDFLDVARAFEAGLPYDDSNRWEILAEVQKTYLKLLGESGYRDRDRERRLAWREGRIELEKDIWMVGVVEVGGVVRNMVEALSGQVRALVHAPEELREGFDSLGCVLPPGWKEATIPLENEQLHVVQRPRDQASAVTDVLRGLDGRFAAEEIVVGVPDPELVPFVEQGLSAGGVPHRFAGGTPLQETGPMRLLQALADCLNGRPFPAFASLVRHPDMHEMVEEAIRRGLDEADLDSHETGEITEVTGALTVLDRYQTRHLQDVVGRHLPGRDRDAHWIRALVSNLERALGLETFEGSRPLSGWMPEILEILVKVYGARALDRNLAAVRQMMDAVTQIKNAASRLATLPGRLDARVDAAEALGVLLAELAGPDLTIPPEPEEHAVELLGWLELPLDDAPAVVVTGVNERFLPEAMGADPFLPGSLRTTLGIPDDGARYARDAYLLSALVKSREEVHLVAGRLSNGGDPLRPSRLLFADEPRVVADRILRFLGEREEGAAGARTSPGREADPAMDTPTGLPGSAGPSDSEETTAPSRFRSPPRDPLPALDSLTRIRVTDFATYLKDPYRYALIRVLNLEPLADDAREMDGGVFGRLAHEVLERFGKSDDRASSDPSAVAKTLSRLLDSAVKDQFGRRPVPAVRVQVEQLRARLHRFARWQAEWVADGWRIMAVEVLPEEGVPFPVDGEEVRLRGMIDRIDHNPATGQWAIFDYKTGDTGQKPEDVHRKGPKKSREWVDLQLPLYRWLLRGVLREDGSPLVPEEAQERVRLGYILLPRDLSKVGLAEAEWTPEEFAEAYAVAEGVIRDLRSKPFHYDPATRSFRDDPLDPLLGRLELPRADVYDDEGDS